MVQINTTVKFIRLNLDYFGMKFNKKIRVGVSILCLLLIFTTSISLIDFDQKNSIIDENLLSISPADDNYETRDGYANNNERYNATDITFWEWSWLSSLDGNGTQWDNDFYRIYIPMGYEHLKVNVTFWHFLGDINVRIWDDYGSVMLDVFTATDNEYVNWMAPSSGYYYIEILGSNSGNTYDLIWTTHPADDMYELNNNQSQAFDISGYRGWWLTWIYGPGRQFDDDWYAFTVNPGDGRIVIDLRFNHFEGDIDIELFDNFISPIASGTSTDDNEQINYILPVITVPTTYYINIYYGNQGNNYDFWFDIVPLDDQYENNDDWTSAVDISGNETITHMGIQSDDDWYKTYIGGSEKRLQVDVDRNGLLGYMEFEIYYDNGGSLEWITWTDDTWIDMNVPWDGWYFIKIYGDNSGNQYDLRWYSNIPYDDTYEENDFDWEAYYLLPFAAQWLPFGPGIQQDDDWYEIYLDPGEERIYVELSFSNILGDIDLEVYYWDGGIFTLLGGSYSYDDYESIDTIAPWSGFYYIKVSGANWGNSYDLWWEDLNPGGGGGVDDGFEDNDDFYNPSWINPNYYPDLRIVDYDEDWFSLFLNSGDNIEVYIYFDHYEGDLELELYDPNNNLKIGSYSVDYEEKIKYTADMSGDWRIRVFHASGDSRVHYDLDIWLNGGGDDQYEENDLAVDAYDLTSHDGLLLIGVQFDLDWYKFDIGEGINNLVIELNYDVSAGDIYVELIDSFSRTVGQGNMGNGHEYFEVSNPASGTYYIRIDGWNNGNWYDLYWSTGGQVYHGDDFYERNNDMEEAYGLWDDERTWLSDIGGLAVQGDDDWYMIEVTPHFSHVIVELEYNYSQGEIYLDLYNDNNARVGVGFNITDENHLFLNTTVGHWGKYFIRITGNNFENEYDLWWDDIRTNFGEDAYEQNDNFINATDLTQREETELQNYRGFGVQYDQDWFEIFVTPDELLLIVEMFYDSAEGLLGFEVYDDTLKKVTGNFTMEDNDFVAYRLRSNGTYYIKIFGDNTGNVYNLLWKTKEDIPIEEIPGYDILILLGSIFGVASIVVIKWKRSKFNRK